MAYAVKVVEYDKLKITQMRTPQVLHKLYLNPQCVAKKGKYTDALN